MHEIAIKSISDDEIVLEGYGVLFGGVDLDGEYFTPETNLMLENVKSVPVLWEHNASSVKDVLGWATPVKTDEVGVFFELALRKSNKYISAIQKLVEQGRMGLSTGALPWTAQRNGKAIETWQVAELSLTVAPMEPRTLGIDFVKFLAELAEDSVPGNVDETLVPESPEATKNIEDDKIEFENLEVIVADTTVVLDASPVEDAVKSQIEVLNARLDAIMTKLENAPVAKAGYVTQDGGLADKTVKSFGDFLMAIKRGDEKRIAGVYGAQKDLGEGSGASGGYLVPVEYSTSLIQVAAAQNQIYSRVQKVPVMRESGVYPALDQYVAPTAGSGDVAYAAGVSAAKTAAGATFTETEPAFTQLSWRLAKIGGYTEVENELLEDSPFAIEALLRGLFAVAVAAKNERNILRGNGIAEPMGILNSTPLVSVADNTTGRFKWEDVAAMYARFKSVGGQPVWVIHPSVWPDIMTMVNSSTAVWQGNMVASPSNNLNGYPIIVSEHMPQLGASGAVLLADLSAYLMFEKAGLAIAYSDAVGFTRDVGTWRFKVRNHGMPWIKNAITLAGPGSAYTVSPFVTLLVN